MVSYVYMDKRYASYGQLGISADDWRVAQDTDQPVGQVILARLIDTLNNDERSQLRAALEANGMKNLPQNLFFNYQTQEWI